MPSRKLIIFPLNGNGIEALDCLDNQEFDFIGFIEDNPEKRAVGHDWPVFGREFLDKHKEVLVLAVPGSPVSFLKREEHIRSLGIPDSRFATIVHPGVSLGRQVQIGFNCLLMAGTVITSNAKIGNHVCILPNTVVHHDAVIEDLTLIGSNVAVAGGTIIEKNCYIGSGSNIINGIRIGQQTLVGMGSNVTKSTPEKSIVAGNPAKPISSTRNPA